MRVREVWLQSRARSLLFSTHEGRITMQGLGLWKRCVVTLVDARGNQFSVIGSALGGGRRGNMIRLELSTEYGIEQSMKREGEGAAV